MMFIKKNYEFHLSVRLSLKTKIMPRQYGHYGENYLRYILMQLYNFKYIKFYQEIIINVRKTTLDTHKKCEVCDK